MSKAGLGFLNMLKTESQQVVVGTGAVSVAGALVYFAYLASIADKLPGTFKKEWVVATAKYRAAMDQDPISQGRGS